jgi:hypothetical protein
LSKPYLFFPQSLTNVLYNLKFFRFPFLLGQLIQTPQRLIDNFLNRHSLLPVVNSLSRLFHMNQNFMLFGLYFFAFVTEPLIRPQLQLWIDSLPKVNQRLKLIQLDILEILRFVINDDSFL